MLPPTATKARIRAITLAVCEVSELDMFYGPSWRELVQARELFVYLLRKYTPLSYPDIAREFGQLGAHSTMIARERRWKARLEACELYPVVLTELACTRIERRERCTPIPTRFDMHAWNARHAPASR
jgi:hypothetical protein